MKKLFFYCLIITCFTYAQNQRGYIVNVGEKAPIFEKSKNSIINELAQYKGKVIMLQFTASWCSVCIKEMPVIEKEIWEVHKENSDFVLIALAKDTKKRPQKEKEIQFMTDKTKVTYPIITDYNSEVFELFAEEKAGVTRNVIIDKNGQIAFLTRLFDRKEFNEMKKEIGKLLFAKSISNINKN